MKSYIQEYYDEITELSQQTNVKAACRAIKQKYNLKQTVEALKEAYTYYRRKIGLSNKTTSRTRANNYKTKEKFVMSAYNKAEEKMMDIDQYCEHYNLPRKDITSYKLVSHTGTPYYNIVFKENVSEQLKEFDFDQIIKKHIAPVELRELPLIEEADFDVCTYADLHIGMDTDADHSSMYAEPWTRPEILSTADTIVEAILKHRKSPVLVMDDLGDLLDGQDGKTVRAQHTLPQNMTNEEAYDCALEFKMRLLDQLAPYYRKIIFNCCVNDNHAGSFGYYLNKAFKEIAEIKYKDVRVAIHRTFISHYFLNDVCFLISHGKDSSTLKFGFKPFIDSKAIEKIDQYCKRYKIYGAVDRIIFKKGDSHQALFDMCSSDDFDYYNYPAASPSSQWAQNNFKKGRRGFVIEHFYGHHNDIIPIFITN